MQRIVNACLPPLERIRLACAVDLVLTCFQDRAFCLVLGGTSPATPMIMVALSVELGKRGVRIIGVVDTPPTMATNWTPLDLVHAHRDQSCIIYTRRGHVYRDLVVADSDPVVLVFELNGTDTLTEREEVMLSESMAEYVSSCVQG